MNLRFKGHLVKKMEVVDSWESFFSDVIEQNINDEARTISNVCVMGTRFSKNGYEYQDSAINKLTSLTSGSKFFLNHPAKEEQKQRDGVRDIRDWAGIFSNAHQDGDKVYADLTVREAFWPLVKDVAVLRPTGIGNSINSRVSVYKDEKGKEHVVDIDVLKSIDLVASAATTQNLFEAYPDTSGDTQEDIEKEEGILLDKMKERKLSRAINSIQYEAMDLIDEIMRKKDAPFKDKRVEIVSILDDLGNEIDNIMTGKTKLTSDSNKFGNETTTIKKETEDDDMDLSKLTLEELRNGRTDLVKALMDEVANSEKTKTMESELASLREKVTELTKAVEEGSTAKETLEKENATLKSKVDEYESKEKKVAKEALIREKIEIAKLPKEAITEVFVQDLMLKDEAGIEASIEDRKAIWKAAKPDGVHGSGDERVLSESEKSEEIKKKEETTKKFKEAYGVKD